MTDKAKPAGRGMTVRWYLTRRGRLCLQRAVALRREPVTMENVGRSVWVLMEPPRRGRGREPRRYYRVIVDVDGRVASRMDLARRVFAETVELAADFRYLALGDLVESGEGWRVCVGWGE